MEAAAEAVAAAKEQSLILKGKRTKRARAQSPIPFSVVPPMSLEVPDVEEDHQSTSIGSKNDDHHEDIINKDTNNVVINDICYPTGVTSSSSASSSNNNVTLKSSEEEDQDMANCLILLAQGHSLPSYSYNQSQVQPQQQTRQLMISYQDTGNNNNNNNNNNNVYRSSSRRFLETSSANGTTTGGARAGYYVYQCKTCDRTFPSFQALGGHRASHKKPKAAATASLHSDELKKTIYDESVGFHLSNVLTTTPNNNNHRPQVVCGKSNHNKVHECGICGAEFTSGQALGGHMRRHRGAVVAASTVTVAAATNLVATPVTANTTLSLSPMSFDRISDDPVQIPVKKARTTVVSLDLDLNLPAPEDENKVNGLSFASKQEQEQEKTLQLQQQKEQKSSLVLSTPTLVDCHY